MTKLSREDVLKLARLSSLQLTEEEIVEFQKEISSVLGYIEQLQNADLEDEEPTYQVTGLKDVMRRDETRDYGYNPRDLLKNVPDTESGHIKTKRVL